MTGTLFVTGESHVNPALRLAGRNLPGMDFKVVNDSHRRAVPEWVSVVEEPVPLLRSTSTELGSAELQ
ncbi:hypothetical protein BKA82DRAFT_4110141 [Pisolithus tinctorius]|nr:hypothetical protein BKA82DRAFT_4110141 [Pisolithus tinctorius]